MKRFGLIGHPLGHSMSPFIHARIMEMAGVNGTYELFSIEPSRLRDEVPRLMRELDGFNCTIPHKDALAEMLGSPQPVNTVFQGRGHNTDFAGFATCGIDFKDKDVLILGAGGTARMMMEACLNAGAKSLAVCARKTFQHSDNRVRVLPWGDWPHSFHILLNATSLGMWPRAWEDPGRIGLRPVPDSDKTGETPVLPVVFDAIYNPTPTRLVLNARKHGCRAIGGLHMLVRQAVEAQKIWNPKITFDTASIEAAILPELSRELLRHSPVHFLLTGFMGAGKTTIAKKLAAKLGVACVDLDVEIEKQTGRSIPDIFARNGEVAFRGIEREVATRVLKKNTSSVIGTGGGFPIATKNQALVRETNTLVLHLEAPFNLLWERINNSNRPLAKSRVQTRNLYNTRLPMYHAFCDCSFNAQLPPGHLVRDILTHLSHNGK